MHSEKKRVHDEGKLNPQGPRAVQAMYPAEILLFHLKYFSFGTLFIHFLK